MALQCGEESSQRRPRGRLDKKINAVITEVRNKTVDNPLLGSGKFARDIAVNLDIEISRQTISSIWRLLHFTYITP
jgi:hypothetical protein